MYFVVANPAGQSDVCPDGRRGQRVRRANVGSRERSTRFRKSHAPATATESPDADDAPRNADVYSPSGHRAQSPTDVANQLRRCHGTMAAIFVQSPCRRCKSSAELSKPAWEAQT